ncbi:MAG: hypothetical protein AAGA54_37250 [Myxococcota bacterium]
MTADQTLSDVAQRLSARGVETHALRELQEELDALERPPSLITRMTSAAKDSASKHWKNFVGELSESKEAMGIIAARVQGGEVSAADRDKVRAQLLDMVKVFPAGLIAAANSAFPVPGTGLFTPWILQRLGLMPSRWREAHLLDQLHKRRIELEKQGFYSEAQALEELEHRLEAEADAREAAASSAGLLTHWDANRNGRWDPEEKVAYLQELEKMRRLAKDRFERKHWFLDTEGEIFGALRLSELVEDPECKMHLEDEELLVCFDGKTGWVALPDLMGREPRFD